MTSQREGPASPSAATAAFLSFLFPGLGQGYLRQARAALVFAVPVVGVAIVVALYLSDGLTYAALRLLEPTVALVATVAIVQLGIWRAFSVLHAWQVGRRTRLGVIVIPVLVAVIALSHGVGALYTFNFMQAGERIFTPDVALDTDLWPDGPDSDFPPPTNVDPEAPGPIGEPVPPPDGASPAPNQPGATNDPNATGQPTDPELPPDSDEPPAEQVPDEDEPEIQPGPAPDIEPGDLDGVADDWTNVLMVGIDWAEGRTHALTDTMIVVSVNNRNGNVYMFSFPRDVAEFPLYHGGKYMNRLNSFANYARRNPDRYPGGGMRALSRQVGFLLGVPIDHYAAVTMPGFKTVLDTVGEITVNNRRIINDPRRNFYLSVGEHRLDRDTTMHFVRSRYGPGNNDFVRAGRQQQVLAALRNEILKGSRLGDLPRIVDGVSRVLSTNYPSNQINDAIRMAELVGRQPTDSWVFGSPTWAVHPPLSETGGRWVIRLRLDKIASVSRQVFGSASLYSR
ncbi:hypothetical protein BH24CHL6_BH24CHL6_15840 [soil metagenome]